MDHLPLDPAMLVSCINMLLRDKEFDSLESLCSYFNKTPMEIKDYLDKYDYVYSEKLLQFRPKGYE